jgi:Flp pilus assembly protein TadG
MEGTTMTDPAPDHAVPTARRPREGGQALVEFALVLPILCVLLFGVMQFGIAFWTYQQVSAAASEGARKAAVSRTSPTRTSDITTAARSSAPNLTSSSMGVTATSAWTAGSPVTVRVTYPVNITIMGQTLFNSNVSISRTARVEQ